MTPEEIKQLTLRIQEFDPDDDYHVEVFDINSFSDPELRGLLRKVYWEATDRAVQLLRGNIVDWTSDRPKETE